MGASQIHAVALKQGKEVTAAPEVATWPHKTSVIKSTFESNAIKLTGYAQPHIAHVRSQKNVTKLTPHILPVGMHSERVICSFEGGYKTTFLNTSPLKNHL
jgi:hypothetical protein